MSVLLAPDPRLLKFCQDFDFGAADARKLEQMLIRDMIIGRGIGLAAPQIGVMVRAFVMKPMGQTSVGLFNPVIASFGGGTAVGTEGCLSFPGQFVRVKRYQQVLVRHWTAAGVEATTPFVGLDARVVQHEIDHLNGITLQAAAPQAFLAAKAVALRQGKRWRSF